jgi:hypothetical protein
MSPDTLITARGAILVALLATLLLSASAIAQVDAGAVRGTVADPTGAVVPNAKVTLTNDATGLSTSAATGSDGTYTFGPIKIGAYTISVEAAGFRKSTTHVTVNVQDQARADFQLVAGAATETVDVTAAAPQLQTQDASVGTLATSQQVNDLPLNGRNYTFLAQLGAGVTKLNPTRGLDGTGSFVANGLTTVHNNYMLDGIDNNNDTVDFLNGAAYANLPPPDAIQEFKVQTSNFSAEFGRAGGAVVNAAVKSGTNQFHGSAWEFLRNDLFDATALDQWFVTPATLKKKGELRRNQYGAAAGGPIIKNKLFIFGDYEGTRIRQSVAKNPTVPTTAEAASGFLDYRDRFASTTTNYTDVLGRSFNGATVFDPATTRLVNNGSTDSVTGLTVGCPNTSATCYVRDPFYTGGSIAGMTDFTTAAQMNLMNQLPSTRIDPNALKLLQLYPAANAPGFFNNYFANRSQPDDNNHFDIRSDVNFSQRDQLFGRVSYGRRHANFPGDFTGDGDDTGFGQGDFTDRSLNVAGSETHMFSSSLINEARFGYSRLRTSAQPASALITGIPAKYGIQGIPQTSENGGLPTISITGLTGLGAGAFASPNRRISDTIQFTENLTKVYGGHSFKGGFEYQRLHFPWIAPAWSRGQFNFGGFTGMAPGVGSATTGGVAMADILLTPIPSTVGGIDNVGGASFVAASNITQPDDLRHYYGVYFQDDWKATSKLTLNMGLRWEIFGGIEEGSGKQAGLLMPNANGVGAQYAILSKQKSTPLSPAFAPLLATDGIELKYLSDSSIFTTPLTNFAPRVGVAYQFTPKLVARAAFGLFYGGFENIGGAPDPGYDYPFTTNLAFSAPNGNILPLFYPNGQQATLENGLTAANPDPASPNFSPNGLGLIGFQRPWKTAYTQEWNGSVQYQLSQSQTITVAYIGNNTHHLLNGEKRNIPNLILPPGTTKTPYLPFPDFQENSDYLNTNGAAYYNAFQITFERRFKQGLNLLADYTRSVCKDDYKNILGLSEDRFNRAPTLPGFSDLRDYTFCGNDVPNIFHASGIWELPIGKGRLVGKNMSGVADAFVGGWSTQWIVTSQDGFPFTITCPNSTMSGDFQCYAPIAKGANPYAGKGPHGIAPFLNASAFVQPAAATAIGQTDFSPLGATWNQVHGPAYNDLDFSVFKKFRTSENTNLEFRAEFFNFLNHPNFGTTGNACGCGLSDANFLNTDFGNIQSTVGKGRETQFALKFYW